MAKPLNLKASGSRKNKLEPQYKDANLAPPTTLSEAEKALWDDLVPHLEAAETVKVTDKPALIAYVQAVAAFNQLVAQFKADPDNTKFPTTMLAPIHSMRTSLGLTPVSRQKIILEKSDYEDREAEKALFG